MSRSRRRHHEFICLRQQIAKEMARIMDRIIKDKEPTIVLLVLENTDIVAPSIEEFNAICMS